MVAIITLIVLVSTTKLISTSIRFTYTYKILKDIKKLGYKVDRPIYYMLEEIIPDYKSLNLFERHVPGFNIQENIKNAFKYKKNKDEILDNLKYFRSISKMSEVEKELVSQFNLLNISDKINDFVENCIKNNSMAIEDENGKIFFNVFAQDGSIIIYQTTGKYSFMSLENLKEEIKKDLNISIDNFLNSFTEIETDPAQLDQYLIEIPEVDKETVKKALICELNSLKESLMQLKEQGLIDKKTDENIEEKDEDIKTLNKKIKK